MKKKEFPFPALLLLGILLVNFLVGDDGNLGHHHFVAAAEPHAVAPHLLGVEGLLALQGQVAGQSEIEVGGVVTGHILFSSVLITCISHLRQSKRRR